MGEFGFKQITPENWKEPDRILRVFPMLTEEIWIRDTLKPQLNQHVPDEVQKLFEVARGSVIYGWFFYPLLAVGSDQLFRTLEAAVHHCCLKHDIPVEFTDKKGKKRPVKYVDQIRRLVELGIVSSEDEVRWDAARNLRNSASHPKDQSITAPGHAVSLLVLTANDINRLFDKELQ